MACRNRGESIFLCLGVVVLASIMQSCNKKGSNSNKYPYEVFSQISGRKTWHTIGSLHGDTTIVVESTLIDSNTIVIHLASHYCVFTGNYPVYTIVERAPCI